MPRGIHIEKTRPRAARFWAGALTVLAIALAVPSLGTATATAGPVSTRIAHATGEIVPIPTSIPHEEGDMVDRRIVPDLRWIAAHFPIYITDGYSGPLASGEYAGCHGCHTKGSDHYNGLAVDIVPQRWSATCDRNWAAISRLALWAEPQQNHPAAPFRWVGYEGDRGHGCGNHLHLSWEHAPAAQFQLAEWVEVFPVSSQELGHSVPPAEYEATPSLPPAPPGGVSRTQPQRRAHAHMGGVSRGFRRWGRPHGGVSVRGD